MNPAVRWVALGAICFLAVTCIPHSIHSAGAEHERNSLKGLRELKVVVEEMEPHVEAWRISTGRLQQLLERKVQEAGIGVAAPDQQLPGNPFLYLNINLLNVAGAPGMHAVHVNLELRQFVYLERERTTGTFGATWRRGTLLVMPVERLEELEHFVARDADEFIQDWRAAQEEQ